MNRTKRNPLIGLLEKHRTYRADDPLELVQSDDDDSIDDEEEEEEEEEEEGIEWTEQPARETIEDAHGAKAAVALARPHVEMLKFQNSSS